MNLEHLTRWYYIARSLEDLRRNHVLSKKQLLELLAEQGCHTSERTLERDLADMRTHLNIQIDYVNDGMRRGYCLNRDDEEVSEFGHLMDFMERVVKAHLLYRKLSDLGAKNNLLKLDPAQIVRGLDYLDPILQACEDKVVLEITHHPFDKPSTKTYLVEPHLVAERHNRWYVVCWNREIGEVRTLALDRITGIKQRLDLRDWQSQGMDLGAMLDKVYGIVLSNQSAEKVVLRTDARTAKYFETLPIHASQQIVQDGAMRCIELNLAPNNDLEQFIMSYGTVVEVLEPMWLRGKIKERILNSAKMYSMEVKEA